MGGNSKHMPHVWEQYDATFNDLFSLLESLTTGAIESTEKFDGVNIHFRVDNTGTVRFSRSPAHIRSGGFTFADALRIYENHPAKQTFIEGCRAIDEKFSNQWWPFGYSGRDWINAEIIFSLREQLLKYDKNAIVMHQLVTFNSDKSGKVIDPAKQGRLSEFYDSGFSTVTDHDWLVLSPVKLSLSNDSGKGYLTDAKSRLRKCMQIAGLTGENTLRDFLRCSLLSGPLSKIRTSNSIKEKLADKISNSGDKVNLVELKRGQPRGVAESISFYGQEKNKLKHQRAAMLPIINTLDAFSSARLGTLKSFLIENSDSEQNRIMEMIQVDANLVNETDDSFRTERSDMFNRYFNEWKQVSERPAAIEGITFDFVGSRTKITGGFATLNQLLGVCRYGRGGVPPISNYDAKKNKQSPLSPEWFALG